MDIEIIDADYHDPRQARDIAYLLNCYACDPMGGGTPLDEEVMNSLAAELAQRPQAFSILAYVNGEPAGLINCFEGFSTFKCRPLVNIHDVVVHGDYRGQGLSQRMMKRVEEIARQRGCCKLTLCFGFGDDLRFGQSAEASHRSLGTALCWVFFCEKVDAETDRRKKVRMG